MTQDIEDMRLLDVAELSRLIGRTQKSIRVDASRRPGTLPPIWRPEGTRKLQWRVADVRAWMEEIAQRAQVRHQAQLEAARDAKVESVFKPFSFARETIKNAKAKGL